MPVIAIVAAALAFSFFSLIPTLTYLYVEKRSRRHWLDASSGPLSRKKAPALVRGAAWLSLALGQLALPILVVPATCGVVLMAISKLGKASFGSTALLGLLACAAIVQALFALRMFPFGIRLLARDAKLKTGGARFAAQIAGVQSVALSAAALTYFFLRVEGFFKLLDRAVRAAVLYGALLPVAAFAAIGLLEAVLVARASRIVE